MVIFLILFYGFVEKILDRPHFSTFLNKLPTGIYKLVVYGNKQCQPLLFIVVSLDSLCCIFRVRCRCRIIYDSVFVFSCNIF